MRVMQRIHLASLPKRRRTMGMAGTAMEMGMLMAMGMALALVMSIVVISLAVTMGMVREVVPKKMMRMEMDVGTHASPFGPLMGMGVGMETATATAMETMGIPNHLKIDDEGMGKRQEEQLMMVRMKRIGMAMGVGSAMEMKMGTMMALAPGMSTAFSPRPIVTLLRWRNLNTMMAMGTRTMSTSSSKSRDTRLLKMRMRTRMGMGMGMGIGTSKLTPVLVPVVQGVHLRSTAADVMANTSEKSLPAMS